MIEVLVALSISVTVLIATVTVGRSWWVYNQEEQFINTLMYRWRSVKNAAFAARTAKENDSGFELVWDAKTQRFIFQRATVRLADGFLVVPPTLAVAVSGNENRVAWSGSQLYGDMRTLSFTRASGRVTRLTIQLGWGEMTRYDE